MFMYTVGGRTEGECSFTEWSEWGECSGTCGPGQRARVRGLSSIEDTADFLNCTGNLTQIDSCNLGACPGMPHVSICQTCAEARQDLAMGQGVVVCDPQIPYPLCKLPFCYQSSSSGALLSQPIIAINRVLVQGGV